MTTRAEDVRHVVNRLDPAKLPEIALRGTARRASWERRYRLRLQVTDAVVIALVLLLAYVLKFGFDATHADLGLFTMRYYLFVIVLGVLWMGTLSLFRTRDARFVGAGPREYQIVVRASAAIFGVLSICTLLFQWQLSRGYLAIVFSAGPLALLVGRRVWRLWLHRRRAAGSYNSQVLVIGGVRSGRAMALEFEDKSWSGFRVHGVWVPDRNAEQTESISLRDRAVPVFGIERTLADVLAETGVDTVAVTDSEHIGPEGMRELAWELEGLSIDLMVAPNVVDVAGSRLVMRTVANRPIIYVDEPQYDGASKWGKAVFDRGGALALLVLCLPLFFVIFLAVKLTSPGPIFFRQERIGLGGSPFQMMKFRSMSVGADADLAKLLDEQGRSSSPLFKIHNDPRITRVGRFLRRYSIDELPQLLNVLGGDMSLVGPRPQVPAEVELYDDRAKRRLHVKPGMTGLWQVSGRSNLTWEEAVQLDLYYVENWSILADLAILVRTVSAVVGSNGAY